MGEESSPSPSATGPFDRWFRSSAGDGAGEPSATRGEGRAELRSLAKWGIPFVLLNVPLLFLFADLFNLNATIYAESYAPLGLNPYGAYSTLLVGNPVQPYNLLQFVAYQAFSFDPIPVAILGKLPLLAATFAAAVVLYAVARREGLSVESSKTVFLSFLFSPFLLFVDDVWGETDAFVILFLLLGFALIRYGSRDPYDGRAVALGALALAWIAFSYYSPAVFLPAFVVYAAGPARKVALLSYLAAYGALFALGAFGFGLISFAPASYAGTSTFNVYSWANLVWDPTHPFSILIKRAAIAAIGLAAVFVPFVVRRTFPLAVSLYLVFVAAVLLAFNYLQGDNFVLFVPLTCLVFVFLPKLGISWRRILLAQSFLLPLAFITEMWNGVGRASGVFYWTYPVFHQNVALAIPFGGRTTEKVLIAAYLVLLAATVVWVLRRAWLDRPHARLPSPPTLSWRPAPWRTSPWTVIGVTGLLVAVPIPFALAGVGGGPSVYTDQFPTFYFEPGYYQEFATYPLPAPDLYTYNAANGTIAFPPVSQPIFFLRNLSGQALSINLTARLTNPGGLALGTALPVILTSSVGIGFATELAVSTRNGLVSPTRDSTTPVSGATTVLANVTQLHALTNSTALTYNFTAGGIAGSTFVFGAVYANEPPGSVRLWTLTDRTGELEADLYPSTLVLRQVGLVGSEAVANVTVDPGFWFSTSVGVSPDGSQVSATVNEARATITVPPVTGTETLVVGGGGTSTGSSPVDWPPSLVTGLYRVPIVGLAHVVKTVAVLSHVLVPAFESTSTSFVAAFTPSRDEAGTWSVNGTPIAVSTNGPLLYLGKLGLSLVGLQISVASLRFAAIDAAPNYTILVLDFSLVLPGVPTLAYFLPRLRSRLGTRRSRGAVDPAGPPEPPG